MMLRENDTQSTIFVITYKNVYLNVRNQNQDLQEVCLSAETLTSTCIFLLVSYISDISVHQPVNQPVSSALCLCVVNV